ncbi:MAG: ABC transporter ATP-binding protein [Alkalispirochaeta sp.]
MIGTSVIQRRMAFYDLEETTPAIRLNEVCFCYGRSVRRAAQGMVLRNFSVSVPRESVTAILGPNGVGKTTLLNLVLGWLHPSSGSITLCGRRVANISRREMGHMVSLVPQDEHIPFEYTLLDFVLLGRAPHLSPLQAPRISDVMVARDALETVGLSHLANQSVGETSGGEKQLAMVARALAQQPRILLMDEPTAHLDLKNKRRTVDLIHRLREQRVTVLFTTHDPEFASVAADRMILLEGGRLLADGPVDAVMTEDRLSRVFAMPLSLRRAATSGTATHSVVVW